MKRRERLPELLAPAGDFDCLVAAVRAGADAVYVGGRLYSARAYAKNFDIDELRRAVSYCHLHGVKLYVTLNTLLYDLEVEPAVEFAVELYRIGVDALIVADLGLVSVLRVVVPELQLHASTQMSVHNTRGADMAYSLGCTRTVLARELSYKDICTVTAECKGEVEIFLHGALCVCHSGQCLFSSLVGGRSGNRGECAQPCRLPYNGGKYPLSLRDLSLAHHIPKLIESGVSSLKIEGRMKAPEYVYTVTSIYRRLLDENRAANVDEERELMRAFSRDGFTDAYLRGKPEEKMTGVRTSEDKAESRTLSGMDFSPSRVPVCAKVVIKRGVPSSMTLTLPDGSRETTVSGDIPSEAINSPLTESSVVQRLCKMGNTLLSLKPESVELILDEGLNLSPASLNALRRAASEAFESEGRALAPREMPKRCEKSTRGAPTVHSTALFYNIHAYNALKEDRGMFDIEFLPLWRIGDGELRRIPDGIAMPPVIMESEMDTVRRMLSDAKEKGIGYALVGNIGSIGLAREFGFKLIGDFRLNVMNSYTLDAYSRLGIDDIILSPELTARDAERLGAREIVYGRIPLMLTERCFMRDLYGCRNCSSVGLTDRRGIEFPAVREFEHRNLIFNSAITYIADKPELLHSFGERHFIFTTESADEIGDAYRAYRDGAPAPRGASIRRIGKREAKK
ncbi:MAG: U32 family peptidase [Clostridia bacterium]|nr:U32 family peptidase [Clostridia bacterium]